jgi:5-methylcytosine-specific restriction endonuclease McrA
MPNKQDTRARAAARNASHAILDKPSLGKRSSGWPRVEKEHLILQPVCAGCGSKKCLQVHHKKPFHLHPELELEQSNLITLCENGVANCHLNVGHLGDWKAYNPSVLADAALWLKKRQERTYESP